MEKVLAGAAVLVLALFCMAGNAIGYGTSAFYLTAFQEKGGFVIFWGFTNNPSLTFRPQLTVRI